MKFRIVILGLLLQASAAMGITEFKLEWMNPPEPNSIYDSSKFPDGIFVVEAWFFGCPYCHENAVNVNQIAEDFADEPRVQVLDVGVDRLDDYYQQWVDQHQPNHPVLKDYKQTLIRQFTVAGFPSAWIVSNQKIQYQTNGVWTQATQNKIRQVIRFLLETENGEPFRFFSLGELR